MAASDSTLATCACPRTPKQDLSNADQGLSKEDLDGLAELGSVVFDSVLTGEQVKEIESGQSAWGLKRRCALLTLTRTRQQLIDGFGGNPDALLEMIEHTIAYEEHCKACAKLAATAVARLMAVAAAGLQIAAKPMQMPEGRV